MSQVVMLPGAHRPEGALAWLSELLGNGGARGIIVVAVTGDKGDIDTRVFGEVPRYSLAYAASVLSDYAVNGEFEPPPGDGE